MSKYHPDYSIEPIFDAVSVWKKKAFGTEKTFFSANVESWTPQTFSELVSCFVENLDGSDNNFWDKLKDQIAPASTAAKVLIAEIIWLLLLFPNTKNWKQSTKRDRIRTVWSWTGLSEPIPEKFLSDDILKGIGGCGQAYKTGLWRELRYAILMFKSLLDKNVEYRTTILSDPWSWGEWQVETQENDRRQFRHIISYLLFPNEYEHISSLEDKRKILAAFNSVAEPELKEMKLVVLDQSLFELRKRLEDEYKTRELSFYQEPLRSKWKNENSEVIGLIACDSYSWKDEAIDQLKAYDTCVMWWHIQPSGKNKTYNALKTRLETCDFFYFYFTQNGNVSYRARIIDIANAEEYKQKVWSNAAWYKKSIEDYTDGEKKAKIVFLMDEMVKLSHPLKPSDFKYWKNYGEPTQANVQPIIGLKAAPKNVSEDVIEMYKPSNTNSPGNFPRNIILFGPPGTGKTYELTNKWIPMYCAKRQSDKEAHEDALREFAANAVWWEVILFVMADLGEKNITVNEIYDHPVLQMKVTFSNNKNIKAALWANLQMHARADSKTVNYTQRQAPAIFDKNVDSTWYLVDDWRMMVSDTAKTIDTLLSKNSKLDEVVKRYEFVTFHQSYSYEEFIEGLRPEQNEDGQISYEVKPGVFQRICNRARLDCNNRYALFIDEINRGNISKIFGELITLIETDKRVSYDENGRPGKNKTGVEITLPYSGKTFGVPENLDIIGTMNTADRSIALLDIALRRRFEFHELMPNVEAIRGPNGDGTIENGTIDLRELLNALNKRIRLLAGRELQLGHAYFCKVTNLEDLQNCFAHKIIPLLQEYFYGHWERIQLVLGDRPEQLTGEQKQRKEELCFILSETLDVASILGFDYDDFDKKEDFRINPNLTAGHMSAEAFVKIYQKKNEY